MTLEQMENRNLLAPGWCSFGLQGTLPGKWKGRAMQDIKVLEQRTPKIEHKTENTVSACVVGMLPVKADFQHV